MITLINPGLYELRTDTYLVFFSSYLECVLYALDRGYQIE